jgi:hypothetical protein
MKSTSETQKNPDYVIVRAFGDEPVRLIAVSIHPDSIEVANPNDRAQSIGFRPDYVYKFEDGLFNQLKAAYQLKQTDKLTVLWGKAMPFRTDAH